MCARVCVFVCGYAGVDVYRCLSKCIYVCKCVCVRRFLYTYARSATARYTSVSWLYVGTQSAVLVSNTDNSDNKSGVGYTTLPPPPPPPPPLWWGALTDRSREMTTHYTRVEVSQIHTYMHIPTQHRHTQNTCTYTYTPTHIHLYTNAHIPTHTQHKYTHTHTYTNTYT